MYFDLMIPYIIINTNMFSIKTKLLNTIESMTNQELDILKENIDNFINMIECYRRSNITLIENDYLNNLDVTLSDTSNINKKRNRLNSNIISQIDISKNKAIQDYISKFGLKSIKQKRLKANNFYIFYKGLDTEDIRKGLKTNLIKGIIVSIDEVYENLYCIHIYFKNQFKLQKHHNKLIISLTTPIELCSKPNENPDESTNIIENHKIDPKQKIFQIKKKTKKGLLKNYYWMKNRCKPIITDLSIDENIMIKSTIHHQFYDYFYKLLSRDTTLSLNELCLAFIQEINRMNLGFYNEYVCNYIFINAIMKNNDEKEKPINIVSIDYRYREEVCNEILFFRPDMVLEFNNILIIMEFKYRVDRRNQKVDSIQCIHFKQYVARCLNYFKNNDCSLYEKIDFVMVIGFSYSNDYERTCGMIYEIYEKKSIECDLYKTHLFVKTMKKYIKRFKNL
jgi:hypothetical protein